MAKEPKGPRFLAVLPVFRPGPSAILIESAIKCWHLPQSP